MELLDSIVGQRRKWLELYYKWCISVTEMRWELQSLGFAYDKKAKCSRVERQGVRVHLKHVKYTTIRSSPFFAYEMSAEKECWTIVYGVGTGPLISIIYKWIHYNNNNNNNNNNNINNNNKLYLAPFPCSPMALYNQKRNRKVNLTYLWWTYI